MKKLLLLLLLLPTLAFSATVTTDPLATGIPTGGALPGPSDSYAFDVISGTRVETTFMNASSMTANIMSTFDLVVENLATFENVSALNIFIKAGGSIDGKGGLVFKSDGTPWSTFTDFEGLVMDVTMDNATSNQVAYTFTGTADKAGGDATVAVFNLIDTATPDAATIVEFKTDGVTKATVTPLGAFTGVEFKAGVTSYLTSAINSGVDNYRFNSVGDSVFTRFLFSGEFGQLTASSGDQSQVEINAWLMQTGTARGIGLFINMTSLTEGSGGAFPLVVGYQGTELLSLDKDGHLGIGTTSPSTALHVDSNAADIEAIATFGNLSTSCKLFIVQSDPEGRVTGSICDRAIGINGNLEGAQWTKHTGNDTNTGWKKDIINHKGSIHIHDNTVPTVLNTADAPHLIFGLFTSLTENGYTFSAGEDGTISSFLDYSSTVAGAVLANSTVLAWTGSQPVTINDTANYNGIFEATFVNTSSFYFIDTFVATETAAWQKGDCLIADIGTADNYNIEYRGFGEKESGGGTDRYEWEIYKYTPGSDPDTIENAEEKKAFSGANVPDDFGGLGETSIADGDHICIGLLGLGHSIDFTNEHFYFRIEN